VALSSRNETHETLKLRGSGRATSPLGTALLASVPLGVALLAGCLLLPRSAVPDDVPLPLRDTIALARIAAQDHALAEEARRSPLDADVRAVGSALRALNEIRPDETSPELLVHARKSTLDGAVSSALAAHGAHPMLELRAVELETFLAEIARFEASGLVSVEMDALGNGFVSRMRAAGWVREHKVLLDDAQRRAAFKMMWNATVSVDNVREFALSPHETRAMYELYLARPHPSESALTALASARRGARDAKACDALAAGERVESERWRIDKIQKLARIDPEYPTSFALGISNYRRGSFAAAAESFRDWIREHPSGRYALRARNYLKASIEADRGGP
jgi:hypothetical protein